MNKISIPDDLEVKFTAKEIIEFISILQKGAFEFVEPVILPLKDKLIIAYDETQSDPKPIGGGGGSPVQPNKSV